MLFEQPGRIIIALIEHRHQNIVPRLFRIEDRYRAPSHRLDRLILPALPEPNQAEIIVGGGRIRMIFRELEKKLRGILKLPLPIGHPPKIEICLRVIRVDFDRFLSVDRLLIVLCAV